MTIRGAFIPKVEYPYFEEIPVKFDWFAGFSTQQKQRSTTAMHLAIVDSNASIKPLEISSSSGYTLGKALSAMSLKKYSQIIGCNTSVESAFQSSRIYTRPDGSKIGPFPNFIKLDGRTCKQMVKTASEGLYASEYCFDGMMFPVPDFHISLFYDYLYLNALLEPANKQVATTLDASGFNCFTDLATKALNSQARSCAIFLSLSKLGLLNQVTNIQSFFDLFRVDIKANNFAAPGAYQNVQLLDNKSPLGVKMLHNTIVQKRTKEDVEAHYNKYKGCVTAENK